MSSITSIFGGLIQLYTLIIIANAILSWIVPSTHNRTVRQIYWTTSRLVNPALAPIRRLLYPLTRNIGIDFSPLVLIILLQILSSILGLR